MTQPTSSAAPVVVAALVLVLGAAATRLDRWRSRPLSMRRASGRRVPPWFACIAIDAGLPVEQCWRWWAIALVAVPPAAWLVAPALAVLVGGAVLAVPLVARSPARRRRDRCFEAALPGAFEAVARSLRAGASLRQALADVAASSHGPLAADLARVVAAAAAGIALSEALEGWARARPRGDVVLAVAALRLAVETGGASAQAVDGLASTIRRRSAVQAEARALSAQARASALVLACAPLAVCGLTVAAGGRAADFLLRTPVGLACLMAGVGLDALGGWWMARLTHAGGLPPGVAAP